MPEVPKKVVPEKEPVEPEAPPAKGKCYIKGIMNNNIKYFKANSFTF